MRSPSSAPRSTIGDRYELRTGRPARQAHLPRRGERDGDREHGHGRRRSTPGETVIGNAACEPHVQDLCRFLVSLGAQIEGIGSNVLRIEGVERALRRRVADRARSTSRSAASSASRRSPAATSRSTTSSRRTSRRSCRSSSGSASSVEVDGTSRARAAGAGARDPGRPRRPDPEDRGRPVAGVPGRPDVDRASTVATQARGTMLIFEKMFESRLFFVDKLVSMGARIILCDPHRAVVTGPAKLYGQRMSSPDIRAGMAMLIAALCAEGTSTIGNVGEIDRGYERIDERLRVARRADRAHRGLVARRLGQADEAGRMHARVDVAGSGEANVATGLPVLDHLLGLLAEYASASTWRSRSRRATPRPRSRLPAARSAQALRRCAGAAGRPRPRLGRGARGRGARARRRRGLRAAAGRLERRPQRRAGRRPRARHRRHASSNALAEGAGLTLHVRLIEGSDPRARARGDLQGARRRARAGCRTQRRREE